MWADGAAYLHDTTRTLAAFLESYPPASATLAGGGGSGILAGLPPLHDELLRLISAAVASFTASQASALGSDDSQLAISQVASAVPFVVAHVQIPNNSQH